MIYVVITAAIFLLDFGIKRLVEKKYQRKERHPRLHNKLIIEKYYNKGAALNFLANKPKILTTIHTIIMVTVLVIDAWMLKTPGKTWTKTGLAMLAGGGLNNLYDRYTKHHVVDYFRINVGPKWLRKIIFNVSDFFVFIGAILAVIGSES